MRCLATSCLFTIRLARRSILPAPLTRPALTWAGDRGEELFCGLQEVLAHAGALGSRVGIAAGDEALAGVVREAELGKVLLVEQGHLQRPVIGCELADGGARRQVIQPMPPSSLTASIRAGRVCSTRKTCSTRASGTSWR